VTLGENTMVNFEIKGIGETTEKARFKPAETVTRTTAELAGFSTGGLFVAIRDLDPSTPNAFGLLFNGQPVKVNDNEFYMQTNSVKQPESGYKTYKFDVPMRFLDGVPKPAEYTIQFLMGTIKDEVFIEEAKSQVYKLIVPQDELPTGTYERD